MNFVTIKKGNKYYHVYENGDIFNILTGKKINTFLSKQGYLRLSLDGKKYSVHKVVIESFKGNSDLQVNHRDGNKLNNNLSNLEYVTASENLKHAYEIGIKKNKKSIPDSKIKEIFSLYFIENLSQKEIAKIFNVSQITISRIIQTHKFHKTI